MKNLITDELIDEAKENLEKQNAKEATKSRTLKVKLKENNQKIKDSLYDFKESVSDFFYWNGGKVLVGSLFTVLAVAVLGAGHHIGVTIVRTKNLANDKLQIESNIEEMNEISKITCNAITASTKDGKYYLEIYGLIKDNPGSAPVFGSVVYEIDKDFYTTVHKHYDIEYEYGKDGQLIGATNKMRKLETTLNDIKNDRLNAKVFEHMADVISKNPAVEIHKYSEAEATATASENIMTFNIFEEDNAITAANKQFPDWAFSI